MADENEAERLEREIAERQARLAEVREPLTVERLRGMSPTQIAALPAETVNRVLAAGR